MKQVSNSLLTSLKIPFKTLPYALAPREYALVDGGHFTPFFAFLGITSKFCSHFPGLSCPPRNLVHSRLGEGRIRNLFHGMFMVLAVLFIAFLPVGESLAGERLLINLKDEAAVASDRVFLKDVANLRGPDSNQIEKLANISLGLTPTFGETAILSRHQIGELMKPVIGPLPLDVFAGASAVQIRLQGRQITADDIATILKSHLLETTTWRESEITIRSIGNLNGIELPPEDGVLRVSSNAAIMGQRRISAPIEMLYGGRSLRNFWITAEIGIRAEVLTATRKISSGTTLTSNDVTPKYVDISDLHGSYARNPEDIVGKTSRRTLSAGDPLTRENFAEPLLVKSGETVRLRLERDGLVLTSLAKAEQNGKLGQMIRVRNIDFSTLLKAQVTGRAEVKMQ